MKLNPEESLEWLEGYPVSCATTAGWGEDYPVTRKLVDLIRARDMDGLKTNGMALSRALWRDFMWEAWRSEIDMRIVPQYVTLDAWIEERKPKLLWFMGIPVIAGDVPEVEFS